MTTTPAHPRRRLKRKTVILAGLACGAALAFGATTQTWFVFTLRIPAAGGDSVTVAGTAATSAMTALSLAGLAATASLTIAGRGARTALAVLGAVLGAGVMFAAANVLADPIHAGGSQITTKTGIDGAHALVRLVARTHVTLWPYLAIFAGLLLAVSSLAVLVDGRHWPAPSKKYEEAGTPETAGLEEDPTDDLTDADERARRGDVAVDHWDRLSRGEDPTRL